MDSDSDILERLWTEVINPDSQCCWPEGFAGRSVSAKHPIGGAKAAMERLVSADVPCGDLGRIGRWLRYECCFNTLYALEDPGLKDGRLAGLAKKLTKSGPDGAGGTDERAFLRSCWRLVSPDEDPHDWLKMAEREPSNEPFGDVAPAIRRLLDRGVSPRDLRDIGAWHRYEAVFHTLRILAQGFKTADEASGLYESLLGADPAGMDARPGSWPLPVSAERLAATATELPSQPDPTEPLLALKGAEDFMLLPGSRSVATWGKGGPIRIWDNKTGTELAVIRQAKNCGSFAFSSDGGRMIIWLGGALRVFETGSGAEILNKAWQLPSLVGWLPHGILVVAAVKDRRGAIVERSFHLLDSETLAEIVRRPSINRLDDLQTLGISPEQAQTGCLWNSSSEEFVRFWRWQSWSLSAVSKINDPGQNWIFIPNCSQILAGTEIKRIHDAGTGDVVFELVNSAFGPAVVSPDSRWVVVGAHSSGRVDIWSLAERRKVIEFVLKSGFCFGLQISDDGRVLGAQSDRQCLFWDFERLVSLGTENTAFAQSSGFDV